MFLHYLQPLDAQKQCDQQHGPTLETTTSKEMLPKKRKKKKCVCVGWWLMVDVLRYTWINFSVYRKNTKKINNNDNNNDDDEKHFKSILSKNGIILFYYFKMTLLMWHIIFSICHVRKSFIFQIIDATYLWNHTMCIMWMFVTFFIFYFLNIYISIDVFEKFDSKISY